MINHRLFECTRNQDNQIRVVIRRLRDLGTELSIDVFQLAMDLTVRQNTGVLDLDRLSKAPINDLLHDVEGITQYLDRGTGTMWTCFVLLCSPTYRNGTRSLDPECHTATLHWIVFPRGMIDPTGTLTSERLVALIQNNAEHYGLTERVAAPHAGAPFADSVNVKVTLRRILLTQRCGYDV